MASLDFFKKPDDNIELNGKIYAINMSLDSCIRFLYVASESGLNTLERLKLAIQQVLEVDVDELQTDTLLAVYLALFDHIIGDDKPQPILDHKGNPMRDPEGNLMYEKPSEQATDFEQDFDYIYAGFMQTYGIDLLESRDMDYRKYKALLRSLPKNTYYREVISIRLMDTKKLKGEDRQKAEKAKRSVALRKGEYDG